MARPERRLDPDLVAEILDEATERPPSERHSWIVSRCGGDTELEGEVLELIGFLPEVDSPERDESEFAPGTDVGGCRIGRVIGRGGMGVVYEAEQLEPRREVAVKTLQGGFLGPDARRRMRLEAAVLARIDHPAVARVLAAGVHREAGRTSAAVPYIVLELVPEARTFDRWWRESGESLATRLERFARICDGVHQAHLRGILHRDLKSANVLVGPGGEPKIIDFGVASLASPGAGDASLAETGHALVGTLANMSPEQAGGRPVDHRSDVYALGTMLYELLAGEPPYRVDRGDLPGSIRRIAETVPPPPSRREPRCRGDLDVIVATALAKDPAERYDSAAGLADDLRRTLADEPILARPTPLPRRVAKAVRRNLAVTLASTAAVLALVTALVASLAGQAKTSRALFAASFANLERMAEAGEVRAARAAFDSLASFGLGEPWAAAVHRGEIEQAIGICDAEPKANAMALGLSSDGSLAAMVGPMDRVRIVDVASMTRLEDLELGHDECYSVEFRENDRIVRFTRLSGRVEEWSIRSRDGDGSVRTLVDFRNEPGRDYLCETSTSADGRWLCGGINGADARHAVLELATGQRREFRGLDRVDMNMAFLVAAHPSRPLFACAGDAGVALLDVSGDEPRWRPTPFRSQVNDLKFSPDGRRLAAITHFGVYLADVPDDAASDLDFVPVEARIQSPWSLAWSPDSRTLAASGRTPEIVLIDVDSRAVSGRKFGGTGYHWRMAFTPDGEAIVSASGSLAKFAVNEAFPRELRAPMAGLVAARPSVAWIDGGELIAATGLATRLVEPGATALGTGKVDPAGERIVVGGADMPTLLLDRRTGRRVELPALNRADLAFSPDGRWLLYTGADRKYVVVDAERGATVAMLDIPTFVESFGSLWLDDRRCITGGAARRAMVERDDDGVWSVREIPAQGLSLIVPLPAGPDGLSWATCTLGATLFGLHEFDPLSEGETPKVELAALTESPRCIAASPDGQLVAAGGSDPRIVVYDRSRRLALGSFPADARVADLAFSPDSKTLAAVDHRGRIQLFDTRTAAEREAIRSERRTIFGTDERQFREVLSARGWIRPAGSNDPGSLR